MSLRAQLLAFGLLTLALPWAGLRFIEQMEAALRAGLESSLIASAGTVAARLANLDAAELAELGLDAGAPAPATVPPDAERESDGAPGGVARSGDITAGEAGPPARATAGGSEAPLPIYLEALVSPPRIDGFRDDWAFARPGITAERAAIPLDDEHRAWAGVSDRFAYLQIEAEDGDIVYQAAPRGSPYGDRVALVLGNGPDAPRALLLGTSAPGLFRARTTRTGAFVPDNRYEDRVLAAWQEFAGGFGIEARIPLALLGGALGLAVIDVDRGPDGGYAVSLAATWPGTVAEPGPVILARPRLNALLAAFRRDGARYRILSSEGWVLADSGAVVDLPDPARGRVPVSEQFFRFLLRRNDPLYDGLEAPVGRVADATLRAALHGTPATAWYRQGPESAAIVAAAVPIGDGRGAVLLEQASDSVLTLTNRALMRLMLFTVVVSVVAAAGLLAYATLLSVRVTRLARAAESALGPRGEIRVELPGAGARDELGDLSRSFETLLGRLREYTDYLRTLSSKLAHELRTPLAIVSSSVDNLKERDRDEAAEVYLARLRQGTARLEAILAAMSAATRVEQAVNETRAEDFDAAEVVEGCVRSYRDVHPDRRFASRIPERACRVHGNADLLAQALDKLVDNAVGFSTPGSTIDVTLAAEDGGFVLSVANPGPHLPEAMRHQLFDSLVSVRAEGDGRAHLGFGLYIVALIAKFHGGSVRADDLDDGSGVIVRVHLPSGSRALKVP